MPTAEPATVVGSQRSISTTAVTDAATPTATAQLRAVSMLWPEAADIGGKDSSSNDDNNNDSDQRQRTATATTAAAAAAGTSKDSISSQS